jgi:hypothetical protein
MYQTWDWINAYLNEEARKLVYDYAFIKTRKGVYLDAYLKNIDRSQTLRAASSIALSNNRRQSQPKASHPVDRRAGRRGGNQRRTRINNGNVRKVRDELAARGCHRPEGADKGYLTGSTLPAGATNVGVSSWSARRTVSRISTLDREFEHTALPGRGALSR